VVGEHLRALSDSHFLAVSRQSFSPPPASQVAHGAVVQQSCACARLVLRTGKSERFPLLHHLYTFIKLPREVRSCSSMAAHMLSSDVYVHELLVTWQPPQTKDTEL
jgi:hypothetical protein